MARLVAAATFLFLSVQCLTCAATTSGAPTLTAAARRAFFLSETQDKPIDHPIIQDAAKFAVTELQKLSDSGVYTTLQLAQIRSASADVGDFHYAVHLRLALSSPHFKSGNASEEYKVIVLESKDLPGRKQRSERSIAIDAFPEMHEDAIEAFWVDMVEQRRRKRAALFAQWQREADAGVDPVVAAVAEVVMEARGILKSTDTLPSTQAGVPEVTNIPHKQPSQTVKKPKKMFTLDDLQRLSTKELRSMLAASTGFSTELRVAITAILDYRLDQLERVEETSTHAHSDEL